MLIPGTHADVQRMLIGASDPICYIGVLLPKINKAGTTGIPIPTLPYVPKLIYHDSPPRH